MGSDRKAPAPEPSAQPVAGAVAEPDCWAILTPNGSKLVSPDEAKGRKDAYPLYAAPQPQAAPAPEPSRLQKMREAGFTARDTRLTCDECGAKFTPQFAPLHECAQPAPSAQAVAHPSHQTVREWMPVSEALRLSDLWTAGDLDNCGQWRAAIKVLADEVRALAASPQPAEPSAQGEPVAFASSEEWRANQLMSLAQYENCAPKNRKDFDIPLYASAPSTPPPAVVEAVPLTDEQVIEFGSLCIMNRRSKKTVHEFLAEYREDRGIAPKAAQEKP